MRPRKPAESIPLRYQLLTGVGGIGTGMFFELEGDCTLGRNESRPARLLPVRDYCKLHIVAHYVAVLLGASAGSERFNVVPIGKLGCDPTGKRLREEMAAAGMDLQLVQDVQEHPTMFSVCFQYPDGAGGNITTSNSAASTLCPEDVERAESVFASAPGRCIALAVPEAPLEARRHFLGLATRHGAFRAVAVASAEVEAARRLGIFEMADLLALNEDEAAAVMRRPLPAGDLETLLPVLAESLSSLQPAAGAILSAGRRGAYGYHNGNWEHCPALQVEVAGSAGAGDALLAGALVGLAGGLPLIQPGRRRKSLADLPLTSALDLGVLLAAFSVTSPHTIHPQAGGKALIGFAAKAGLQLSEKLESLLAR